MGLFSKRSLLCDTQVCPTPLPDQASEAEGRGCCASDKPACRLPRLNALVAGQRYGDAVKMFMRFVGTPAIFSAIMPLTPVWGKLKAVAPTLPYDITIMHEHQRGRPLTTAEWAAIKVPALRFRRW